ncbi:unnamed protein product [Rotaria sordida]|uniref:Uncharacterized protein n=1 Tax=Rotaria sordida TaxID=392033 RepID=A0A814R5D1_9BILA|nr:unnamed protein product [Rotaria sordida]
MPLVHHQILLTLLANFHQLRKETRRDIDKKAKIFKNHSFQQHAVLESIQCLWLIKDEGVQHLADALRSNTTLTILDLQYNETGDEGAQHLADALQNNTTLTTLYLYGTQIGWELAARLGELIKPNNQGIRQ